MPRPDHQDAYNSNVKLDRPSPLWRRISSCIVSGIRPTAIDRTYWSRPMTINANPNGNKLRSRRYAVNHTIESTGCSGACRNHNLHEPPHDRADKRFPHDGLLDQRPTTNAAGATPVPTATKIQIVSKALHSEKQRSIGRREKPPYLPQPPPIGSHRGILPSVLSVLQGGERVSETRFDDRRNSSP